jgi:hypothetical protein
MRVSSSFIVVLAVAIAARPGPRWRDGGAE